MELLPLAPGEEDDNLYCVYVWDRIVRATHWLIAFSIFVLAATGFYMGNPFIVAPGEAGEHHIMQTVQVVHFATAIVFSLAVLARIYWMFAGPRHARWREFIPVSRTRRQHMAQTLAYYLFLRREPPPSVGHNALAGATYVIVFLLYLFMMLSGFGLYSISAHVDSPLQIFSFVPALFGGAQNLRWLHHIGMWLLLGFFVHHISSAIQVAVIKSEGTIDSMFSGHKWVKREDLETE
jgi:Ni/Fe-hydrogenase 1 B-type cytochrome subunit